MSILYLKLKSINSKGQFVDYKIFDIFKDIDEMLDWFAYGFDNANRKPIIADSENNFRYKDGSVDYPMNVRYENFVSCQNLTGFDKVSSLLTPYEIRKLHYDFDEPSNDFFYKYESLRENVLYDSDNNRIIDIRNYAAQIISHICSMKEYSDWAYCNRRRSISYQNRTHTHGFYGYHWYGERKIESLQKSYYIDPEDIPDGINVVIYRQSNAFQHKSSNHKKSNSWKDNKVRKQWQWHKNVSCKSHYSSRSKYCDDSWIDYEEEAI